MVAAVNFSLAGSGGGYHFYLASYIGFTSSKKDEYIINRKR